MGDWEAPAMIVEGLILALLIGVTLIPSMFIGMRTADSISTWYEDLKKPSWNPPNWIFGPVWTVLYICMAVAFWLVWKQEPGAVWPLRLYVCQLLVNWLWSPAFFLWKRPGLALGIIAVLWCLIVATTLSFAFVSMTAAQLMLPYLLWVSFASYLNMWIWKANKPQRV